MPLVIVAQQRGTPIPSFHCLCLRHAQPRRSAVFTQRYPIFGKMLTWVSASWQCSYRGLIKKERKSHCVARFPKIAPSHDFHLARNVYSSKLESRKNSGKRPVRAHMLQSCNSRVVYEILPREVEDKEILKDIWFYVFDCDERLHTSSRPICLVQYFRYLHHFFKFHILKAYVRNQRSYFSFFI